MEKPNSKIKYLIYIFIALGILIPLVVLLIYNHKLGGISNTPDDWGSFGSLLGGIFTLLSAVATLSTLLFLYSQQENTNKIINEQLNTLIFERYLNHRKLFIQMLKEIENSESKKVKFTTPHKTYSSLFPNNGPTSCGYSISLNIQSEAPGSLKDCLDIFKSINDIFDDHDRRKTDIIIKIMKLHEYLGYERISSSEHEITFNDDPIGMGIDELREGLITIEEILNSILEFSGNNPIEQIHHKIEGSQIKIAIQTEIERNEKPGGFKFIKNPKTH